MIPEIAKPIRVTSVMKLLVIMLSILFLPGPNDRRRHYEYPMVPLGNVTRGTLVKLFKKNLEQPPKDRMGPENRRFALSQ